MKPIHVLFVMRDAVPPFRPDARVMFGIELARKGVSTHLVGPRSDRAETRESPWRPDQVSVTGPNSGMVAEALKPWRDARAILRLPVNYDLVMVRDRTFSALATWALARLRGKPFAFWMSFPMVEGYEGRAREVGLSKGPVVWLANHLRAFIARRAYYGFIAHRADHIFVQSEAMREWMAAQGFPLGKMTAVPMGVDTERLAAHTVEPSDDPRFAGRRVVVYLGDLGRARKPEFLLDLAETLRQRFPDLLLVLAGEAGAADEREWLRQQVSERKLDSHVWITGWLPQKDALRIVRRAEVGLSPIPRGPLYDVSSPTKALEYLAMGVPCVANDIPDQRYAIEASGGGICVPMEVPAFADAVTRLLHNPQEAREMGARGPDFIRKERSYDVLSDRVLQVIRRLATRLHPAN